MQCIGTGDVIQISSIVVHVWNWNRALRNIWYAVVKFENVSEWDGYERVKKGRVSASCTRKLCVRMRALTLFNCVAQSDYAILYIFDIAFWVNGSHEQNSMYHHNWIPLFVLTMQRKKEFISILNLLLFSLLIFLFCTLERPGLACILSFFYCINLMVVIDRNPKYALVVHTVIIMQANRECNYHLYTVMLCIAIHSGCHTLQPEKQNYNIKTMPHFTP